MGGVLDGFAVVGDGIGEPVETATDRVELVGRKRAGGPLVGGVGLDELLGLGAQFDAGGLNGGGVEHGCVYMITTAGDVVQDPGTLRFLAICIFGACYAFDGVYNKKMKPRIVYDAATGLVLGRTRARADAERDERVCWPGRNYKFEAVA